MNKRLSRIGVAAAALVVGLGSCMDATDVELLEVLATGTLSGQLYLDLNRDGTLDGPDVRLNATIVRLMTGAVTIGTTTTDANGTFLFDEVPAGRYQVEVDDAVLGDSLATLTGGATVAVNLGDTVSVQIGVSFPQLSLDQVRAAPPGRRVFTTGIALNVRDNPADGRVFLSGSGDFLQATNVPRQPNIAVGDSVRLLGRTVMRDGQPMLVGDSVPSVILVPRATVPTASVTSTALAATANGGALDAALVRIRDAEIIDTATVGSDFHFTADDGSGPVSVVVRPFLGANTSLIRPDTIFRVDDLTGMLSPHDDGSGNVRWRLLARSASEILLETRTADLRVSAAFEPNSGSQGDMVDLTVVISNIGPLAANGVQVSDTLPSVLTRRSASTTSGSYSSSGIGGRWALTRLDPGASDTLRLSVEITGAGTGTVSYIARTGELEREFDPDGGNNRAVASITRVAPR